MSDVDVYLAVPLEEEDELLDPSVKLTVHVTYVETMVGDGRRAPSNDDPQTTLYVGDAKLAITLAMEILRQVRDRPGEAEEIEVHSSVRVDEFQCERLTEDEARVVHERYLERMAKL